MWSSLSYNIAPDTSDKTAKRATRMWHECYTNDASAKWVKKFDFGNDTSENIFSKLCISYMAIGRLKGKKQFHSKNYFIQNALLPFQNAFKSAPQKLNFVMAKAISKRYSLDFILLTEQISLSGCLYFVKNWTIYVL